MCERNLTASFSLSYSCNAITARDLDTAFVERSEAVRARRRPILTRLVGARLHLRRSKARERKANCALQNILSPRGATRRIKESTSMLPPASFLLANAVRLVHVSLVFW